MLVFKNYNLAQSTENCMHYIPLKISGLEVSFQLGIGFQIDDYIPVLDSFPLFSALE